MDERKLQPLQVEYQKISPDLNKFKESLVIQIEELLGIEKIALGFPIQNRTKEWSSIADKVKSGRYTVKKSIVEMQDLVGLRIVLLFNRDTKKVCEIIEKNLNVIRKYDTTSRLQEDQFGYSSTHYVVSIPEQWSKVPTFRGLDQYSAEIQVRTLSQHTWAEASSELQYKNEQNVPKPLLRSIGRVSALLETVDLEFERLLIEREEYKVTIKEEIKKETLVKLNVDNLAEILSQYLPSKNHDPDDPDNYSEILDELIYFKIGNIDKLIDFIKSNKKEAIETDQKIVEKFNQIKNDPDKLDDFGYDYDERRNSKGVFYTHTGLIRAMFKQKFPKKWTQFKKEYWGY
ncbi:RelA/SpoT domain-containing protein [uncultured Aquimarina sp.]|uniref:GTP pyrophosphokinase n=1 Tax=uncultured Aquimarina sp. TaxID=575652 RepID=UPI00262A8109|nr:RelA/SpoT domain-containing protein [uncultured Aquimarina sp.]